MAKGQKHGNREVKKPKASKKPAPPASTFLNPASSAAAAKPGKK
jgi:hypothetical protein